MILTDTICKVSLSGVKAAVLNPMYCLGTPTPTRVTTLPSAMNTHRSAYTLRTAPPPTPRHSQWLTSQHCTWHIGYIHLLRHSIPIVCAYTVCLQQPPPPPPRHLHHYPSIAHFYLAYTWTHEKWTLHIGVPDIDNLQSLPPPVRGHRSLRSSMAHWKVAYSYSPGKANSFGANNLRTVPPPPPPTVTIFPQQWTHLGYLQVYPSKAHQSTHIGGQHFEDSTPHPPPVEYRRFCIKVTQNSSPVEPQSLPPTSSAAKFHNLRVFYQMMEWKGGSERMDLNDWGWHILDG